MTYAELMEKSDNACKKALQYYSKGDKEMSAFWKNASIGFKIKAREMLME